MGKKTFSEGQISLALRGAETGTPVSGVCGGWVYLSNPFYRWKKKCTGMGIAELRRVRLLNEENRKRKGIVAELMMDKKMLQHALSIKV